MISDDPIPSTLTTFTASDGENLAVQDWPLPEGEPCRGTVLLVHGLGEHVGRYDPVARRLNDWGFAVRGYDHYGHGESAGPRGGLTSDLRLLDDLADLVDATRARMPQGQPLVLLGHSMGGLVAATWVLRGALPVDALVLSSPALDAGIGALQKKLIALLYRFAPNLAIGNGLDASKISHNPATVEAYRKDPLVHDRISARLARFIDDNGPAVVAAASQWRVPTLLMYAGADHLVRPAGSKAFAATAPRKVVHSQAFDGLYHEIFNEADPSAVFGTLKAWLDVIAPAA